MLKVGYTATLFKPQHTREMKQQSNYYSIVEPTSMLQVGNTATLFKPQYTREMK